METKQAAHVLDEGGPTFAELKENLFFTERRLALLLDSSLHPEMVHWVQEKKFVRAECKNECMVRVNRLEESVSGKMRGVWNDVRIVQAFNVEVNLRSLVGCEWYEKPKTSATKEASALITRIRDLAMLVSSSDDLVAAPEVVNELVSRFEKLDWSANDIARLTEALKAKEKLLLEVSDLTKSLQEIGWSCSIHEAKKEEIRRKAKQSEQDGEVDLFMQHTQEDIDVCEALMQLLLFKLQTTESSQAENTLKRRNNVSQWKLAAAQLETLKEQKMERQKECIRDEGRLHRGLAHEANKHEEMRKDFRRRKKQFDEKLEFLNRTQDELMGDLESLSEKFKEVEEKLTNLSSQRMEAVQASVEIVEAEAQRVADYQEFVRFAAKHGNYVKNTQNMAEESTRLINSLQRFLMNEQDYDEHDFHQTTKLLRDTKLKTLQQLNICYVDYCTRVMKVVRHLDMKIRNVETEASRQEMLAECCRETLNAEAKRHVMATRAEQQKAEELHATRKSLLKKIDFVKGTYFRKVKEELPSHLIQVPDMDIECDLLNRRDDLLNMREEMQYSAENKILDEKEEITAMTSRAAEERGRKQKKEGKSALKLRQQVGHIREADEEQDEQQASGAVVVDFAAPFMSHSVDARTVAPLHQRQQDEPVAQEAAAPFEQSPSSPLFKDSLAVTSTPKTIRPLEQNYGQGLFPSIT